MASTTMRDFAKAKVRVLSMINKLGVGGCDEYPYNTIVYGVCFSTQGLKQGVNFSSTRSTDVSSWEEVGRIPENIFHSVVSLTN